jgi:hypothetical protein
MLEALVIAVVVAAATMALGRHIQRESGPDPDSCAGCTRRCSGRSQCAIIAFKEGVRQSKPHDEGGPNAG